MNDACNDSDVTITLDDKNCALLSRSNDLITCDPGETFPGTARTVQVKVKIGNKEFAWGELKINSFWTNTEFIGIAAGAGVFLIAIIVIVICIVRCRNRTQDHPDDGIPLEITPSHTTKGVENEYTRINPVAFIQPQQTLVRTRTPKEIADAFCKRLRSNVGKVVKTSLIERCNIEPGKICTNKGKKIRVISGQYNASTSSPYSGSSLTIKTLLESYPEEGDLPDWLNNNLLECTGLQDFDNDNVLRMKGIAVDAKNIYIIYPAMSNKTLKDYLISKKEHLTTEQRLEICTQVAEGMNYLSTQGIVHKDLAARNCWVSRDFEVKISDASFSFDLYPDEYLESIGRYQPIRWMAPESLRQGFYDTKSDVWSYGVLVWEVFTNGHMPYFEIRSNDEVKQKVRDEGYRLRKPNDCSDAIFHVLEECHKNSSEDRPNFFIVQNMLDNIINPTSPIVSYANQQDLAAGEDGMEDYENIRINPPPRPPKGRRP
ncbi:tyrosine-protein kinase TXK-like isoform X2 [Mercenaria mercenaria]|uniref:tyrosine-protein kinase TXK-like isoform X2 n=1 Tax=Mercenaria mercenaria TaxID=6596 RepID=UPI00234E8203|nr:tyrosine-protein kinase TXK-like isoform X2 [Mercenaria mercenaria]